MTEMTEFFHSSFLHLVKHGGADWRSIALDKVFRAMAIDSGDEIGEEMLRTALIEVAAAVQTWAAAIDRRKARRAARAAAAGRA